MKRNRADRVGYRPVKGQRGFSLIEVLLVVTIIGIIATFAIPNLLRSQVAAREAAAASTVRNLITTQETFSLTKGYGKYSSDLATLQAAQLIDSALATGVKGGYTYSITLGGGGTTFSIGARPGNYGGSGFRSFYGDQTAVIRFTTEDRDALASDPPLER